jgi:glycosyltransferase involved in cell wall biosynthesis
MPSTAAPIRVLMVSKACLVGAYQRKLEEMAAFPDIELTVIVPPLWREPGGAVLHLEREHVNGYTLLAEPMLLNGDFHLHFYPRLARHLKRIRPHILHIDEEPYNLATFHVMWMAQRYGARALFFTWQNLNRRYPLPFRWIERYNLHCADYGIAGNHEAVAVWRAKGYVGPMAVIPQFGVDPDLFKPQGRKEGGTERGFVIGCVARLIEDKGVDVLLRAVAGLPGVWRLYILGAGPQRQALEGLAHELRIADRVVFDKPIPSVQMPAYLTGLDALVLPSRTRPNWKEQFGRILVEAMACGVPVVGSTCGEIPQVIGDAGLIFPEEDAGALRDALARIQRDDDLRRELAQRGRARVLANYTQKQIAAATVEVYRQMMRDRTPTREHAIRH